MANTLIVNLLIYTKLTWKNVQSLHLGRSVAGVYKASLVFESSVGCASPDTNHEDCACPLACCALSHSYPGCWRYVAFGYKLFNITSNCWRRWFVVVQLIKQLIPHSFLRKVIIWKKHISRRIVLKYINLKLI